jgi:hypothetical protein
MSDQSAQSGGTDPQSTVAHAADIFEARLFPDGEHEAEPKPGEEKPPKADPSPEPKPDAGEGEETAGAEGTEQEPRPRSRKLKLGDEEVEVSEDEAYLGYLRTADYTRKTQALAELRKNAEQEQQQTREQRAKYLAELEELKRGMDALVPKEPDWDDLRRKGVSDAEISAAAGTYQQFKRTREAIEARQKKIVEDRLADERVAAEKYAGQEAEQILEALPEWRDPSKGDAERERLVKWLYDKGWTKNQIESIVDHRLVVSIYQSMLYEDLQTKKTPKPRPAATKAVAPGSPTPAAKPVDERGRRSAQLAKSGKVTDAARVFETFMPD